MTDVSYRLFFGDRAATEAELDRIEQITVEQEMDMAWEAQIKLYLCLDEQGRWQHRADEFAEPFSRVRLEIRRGTGDFVPLIDGPVAGYDTTLDPDPGRSTVTLKVRDDSVFLNRDEETEVFEDRNDAELAEELLRSIPQIADVRVDSTDGTPAATVRRGTVMKFLRELARANGFHAYVLPGLERGRSIGCFRRPPSEAGDLPALILLGSERNLDGLEISEDSEAPERTRSYSLSLADQQVERAERSAGEVALLREFPAIPDDLSALREVPPEDATREDPERAADAQARRRSYAYKVTGAVESGCYPAVLTPYEKVSLRAADLPLSGDYLLTKVTHRLTASAYRQEFEAKADSRSDPARPSTAGATGLSVDFSQSISVF